MASHPDYVAYVVEQLRGAGSIRARKMFGEYGLYCDGTFFAVICDDQLFIKITPPGKRHSRPCRKRPPTKAQKIPLLWRTWTTRPRRWN